MAELAYSVVETARLLGCGEGAIDVLVKRGQIPYIRVAAKQVIIPKAALEKWLLEKSFANMEQEPKAPAASPGFAEVQSAGAIGVIEHSDVKPGSRLHMSEADRPLENIAQPEAATARSNFANLQAINTIGTVGLPAAKSRCGGRRYKNREARGSP
jgi:excisionase family DNA binding protein